MIVLDTNVVSEAMRPSPDANLMAWLRRQPIENLALTAVTLAEIHYGLTRLPSGRRKHELEGKFRLFVAQGFAGRVLPFDAAAAAAYGEIVSRRERSGRPIEAFDAMIAAIARTREASLATRNVADFEACGLSVQNPWTKA